MPIIHVSGAITFCNTVSSRVRLLCKLLINFFRHNELCDERLPLPYNRRSCNYKLLKHNPIKCSSKPLDQLLLGLVIFINITIKIVIGRLNNEYYTLSYVIPDVPRVIPEMRFELGDQ